MKNKVVVMLILGLTAGVLAACGGGNDSVIPDNVTIGTDIYEDVPETWEDSGESSEQSVELVVPGNASTESEEQSSSEDVQTSEEVPIYEGDESEEASVASDEMENGTGGDWVPEGHNVFAFTDDQSSDIIYQTVPQNELDSFSELLYDDQFEVGELEFVSYENGVLVLKSYDYLVTFTYGEEGSQLQMTALEE